MASKAIGFLNFKFGADLSGFQRALKKAQKGLKKFGKWAKQTGQTLSRNLTLPITALGGFALKTFADFEQGMLKVKAISGATDSEFKALTESAKELGSTTMFTASQVAELQLNLSKLGFDPQSILDSSQAILNLAQATDSDLGEAATVAASTMNAFGLEAKDMTMISDVMADSFSSSALDLQKFQTAMASVAPVANQAGADIQRTSAILGVLVNNGIEASSAGTALRNVFLELANKGLTWDEAMIKIQTSMNPLKTAMDLFGKRGSAVATIIANNGAEIQALTDDFNDSAGEAQKMADIMDFGVGGAFRRMQSQLEGANIELGEKLVPIFMKVAKRIEKLIKWFTNLSDEQQEQIVFWGLIVAAIGPVITILGVLSISLSALMGPMGLLVLGISAIAGYAAYDSLSKTAESTDVLAEAAERAANQLSKLEEVNKSVNESTKDEIDKVGKLIATIKNGESTRTEQINALKELKKISPEYFGELKIGVSSLEDIMLATEDYTTSLKNLAKVEFVASQTKPLYGDLLEAEMALRKFKETAIEEFGDPLGDPFAQEMIDKHTKQYLFNIEQIQNKIDEYNATLDEVGKTTKKVVTGGEEIVTVTEKYSKALDPLIDKIKEYADLSTKMWQDGGILEGPEHMLNWTEKLTKAQEAHNATMELMEDIMFNAAMSAANSQEKFFKSFIENIKQAIKQLLIQLAVLTVIALLLGGGTIAIGEAFSIAKGKVLGFADGGLVYGPTTALIGEGVGTTASNPEVVAPLDKLKQYMGGGNQNIIVEGVLKGNDIYLSNRNTSLNRLRTT